MSKSSEDHEGASHSQDQSTFPKTPNLPKARKSGWNQFPPNYTTRFTPSPQYTSTFRAGFSAPTYVIPNLGPTEIHKKAPMKTPQSTRQHDTQGPTVNSTAWHPRAHSQLDSIDTPLKITTKQHQLLPNQLTNTRSRKIPREVRQPKRNKNLRTNTSTL